MMAMVAGVLGQQQAGGAPVAPTATVKYADVVDASATTPGSYGGTFDCGTVTTGAVMIFAIGGTKILGSDTNVWTCTKSSGSCTLGTITQRAVVSSTVGNSGNLAFFSAPVTAGGTLVMETTDGSETTLGMGAFAVEATGHDATTPFAGTVNDFLLDDTITLGATPAAADMVFQVIHVPTTPGPGKGYDVAGSWVDRGTVGESDDIIQLHMATLTGSTSTTVTWSTEDGDPETFTDQGIAFILKAA